MPPHILFYQKGMLSSYLTRLEFDLTNEIQSLNRDYLLKVNEQDLLKTLLSKYIPRSARNSGK